MSLLLKCFDLNTWKQDIYIFKFTAFRAWKQTVFTSHNKLILRAKRKINLKAKKSYGQHFLTSEEIASQIADGLQIKGAYNKVLEIGPGQGMLTKYLLEKDYELLVVEADDDMVFYLKKHFPQLKDFIINADFLKIDLHLFFKNEPFAIIGNFP